MPTTGCDDDDEVPEKTTARCAGRLCQISISAGNISNSNAGGAGESAVIPIYCNIVR
jgi:hypothetical protein